MLDELLGRYFDAGVAEGREGRNHDTEDGLAQRTFCEIREEVRRLVAAERESCHLTCRDLAKRMKTTREKDAANSCAEAIYMRSNMEISRPRKGD